MREFFSKLTWVDYIALAAVLRGLYVGYKAGFFHELLRVTTYVVTLVVTMIFFERVAQMFALQTSLNVVTARIVGFSLLLVVTFVVAMLIQLVLLKLLKVGEGGLINRLLGMVVGGARLMVLLSFLFLAVDSGPVKQLKEDVHNRSLIGDKISLLAPMTLEFFSHLSPELKGGSEKSVT